MSPVPLKRPERLAPGAVAAQLLCLETDRDERASPLFAEMLLTLVQNGYQAPETADQLTSPKRPRFAVRSLAVGENFLGGRDRGRAGDTETTPAQYGARLAAGQEMRGSANLALAQRTLEGLVDPETTRAQKGTWLLRPFHESLLWYDARKGSPSSPQWGVRKVYMRGKGITFARMLLDGPDEESRRLGAAAVASIKESLTGPTPLASVSGALEEVLDTGETYARTPDTEADEREAWERGADSRLAELAGRLCRHAEGVMGQEGASGPAKLWQLRTVVALDFATHIIRTGWDKTGAPDSDRFLLLTFGGGPRATDPIRQRSEEFYRRARIRLSEAIVQTLAEQMEELDRPGVSWAAEFQARSPLGADSDDSVASQLRRLPDDAASSDYEEVARSAVEATNANYGRGAGDGFRVLLESIGMLVGTGAYRYLTADPTLLGALVGALSAQMPMSSRDFFAALRREWGLVVNQESAAGTALAALVDGTGLERNARKAEKLMSDAGLALGLSDRTTMVGERARRTP